MGGLHSLRRVQECRIGVLLQTAVPPSSPGLGRPLLWLDAYVATHRGVLLAGAADPGTVFVKTRKRTSTDAAYNQTTFYEAWRLIIQLYGIYNPYTGRGAIPGLLPHGPHSVRDVLATHVLKTTGSYEQASYAIHPRPRSRRITAASFRRTRRRWRRLC